MKMWNEVSKSVKSIAVVGNSQTGKTCLVYRILESFDRPIHVFKHPKPELIEKLGFHNMYGGLAEVEELQDCVFWIDEPQLYITLYEKRGNTTLMRLLSLCAQRNIVLIISTSDTRFITRGIESYIDVWCLKDLEFDLVKRGSIVKKIVRDTVYLTTEGFRLDVNEYVFYSRNFRKFNGKKTFTKPKYFTIELSRPYYQSARRTPTRTAKRSAEKVKEVV